MSAKIHKSKTCRNEHKKHQSDCPFVQLNKQDEIEWTVDELYDLYKKYKTKEYVSIIVCTSNYIWLLIYLICHILCLTLNNNIM